MKIGYLIGMLEKFPSDMEVEVECPNGLLVEPIIKRKLENPNDIFSKVLGYVISW